MVSTVATWIRITISSLKAGTCIAVDVTSRENSLIWPRRHPVSQARLRDSATRPRS